MARISIKKISANRTGENADKRVLIKLNKSSESIHRDNPAEILKFEKLHSSSFLLHRLCLNLVLLITYQVKSKQIKL